MQGPYRICRSARGPTKASSTRLPFSVKARHNLAVTPSNRVKIQLPLPLRAYAVAFLIVWIGAVGWTTMIHHHGSSIIVGVIFGAFGVALGYRLLRFGVRSEPDRVLQVHNHFGRRQLVRTEIEEFRVSNNGGSRLGQRGVQALLRDGTTYGLDVCRAPLGIGMGRLGRQLDQLNAWLRSAD